MAILPLKSKHCWSSLTLEEGGKEQNSTFFIWMANLTRVRLEVRNLRILIANLWDWLPSIPGLSAIFIWHSFSPLSYAVDKLKDGVRDGGGRAL